MVPKRETAVPEAADLLAAVRGVTVVGPKHGISASSCLLLVDRAHKMCPEILDIRIDRWVRPTGYPGLDCPVPMEAKG